MQEEGFANMVTDLLKEAMGEVSLELKDMFKGVKPFRYNPPPLKDRIQRYLSLSDEQKLEYRNQFGDEFDKYESDMIKTITKGVSNA